MSDFTIRTSTTPPATVKVQLDPSQSVAEAVAAADAAAASEAAALESAAAAAGSASDAFTSADAANTSAINAAASASAASTDADDAAASAAAAAATLDSSLKKADNLSDLADAATARTNLGVPPSTRTITAGTGLTGGGDLSADRTISASIASQAEAEAGTADNVLMTPLKLRQGLRATGTAPIYACRAWVNFNGTGTVAIRGSGNVTSITDNSTGNYTVNFATAMPDANYAAIGMCNYRGAEAFETVVATSYNASSVTIGVADVLTAAAVDTATVFVSVFR